MEKRNKTLRLIGLLLHIFMLLLIISSTIFAFCFNMEVGLILLFVFLTFETVSFVLYMLGTRAFRFYVVALCFSIIYYAVFYLICSVSLSYLGDYYDYEMRVAVSILIQTSVNASLVISLLIICLLPYAKSNDNNNEGRKKKRRNDNNDCVDNQKANNDYYDELKIIKNLYDEGILREDEYQTEKEKILKKIQ